jgi:glycosyltransferase involved in cell wall biosynthesis
MPPIKVLHLISTLTSGGAERQLVNLIHNTSREIINHVVCVIGEADFFAPNIREANYKVVEMGIFAKHPFFRAALKFRQVVREEKPDIIHTWLYDANISARLVVLNGKVPIVTSLQFADYEPEAGRIGNYNPHKVRALRAMLCINSNHSLSDKTKMFLKLFLPYSFIKFRRKEVYSKGKHKNIKELLKNGFD